MSSVYPLERLPYFDSILIAQQNKQIEKITEQRTNTHIYLLNVLKREATKGKRKRVNKASIWRILDFKLIETKQVLELQRVRKMCHK